MPISGEKTRDLGGELGTSEFADAVIARLEVFSFAVAERCCYLKPRMAGIRAIQRLLQRQHEGDWISMAAPMTLAYAFPVRLAVAPDLQLRCSSRLYQACYRLYPRAISSWSMRVSMTYWLTRFEPRTMSSSKLRYRFGN